MTTPGETPALGDPTAAELWALSQGPFWLAVQWTGLPMAALAAISGQVGELAHARDLVLVPRAAWQAGLLAAAVEVGDGAFRPLEPAELAQAAHLRRTARLLVGLPPEEAAAPERSTSGEHGDTDSGATTGGGAGVDPCTHCPNGRTPGAAAAGLCAGKCDDPEEAQTEPCCAAPAASRTPSKAARDKLDGCCGPFLDQLKPRWRRLRAGCLPARDAAPAPSGASAAPAQSGASERAPKSEQAEAQGLAVGRKASQKVLLVEVWELQRRTTLFTSSWRAPFLPHDRQKQWRWVDRQYARHAWTDGTQESCAQAEEPPIQAPRGWRPETAGWVLADALGTCDNDKWQYALDFYAEDGLWGRGSHLCHCRRRLWQCRFLQAPAAPRAPPAPPAPEGPELAPVLEARLPPRRLAPEAEALFQEDWRGSLLLGVFEEQDFSEVHVGPWLQEHEAPQLRAPAGARRSRARRVSLRCPCSPSAFAPESTRAVATLRISELEAGDDVALEIEGEWAMQDVPFGDCFTVRERISLVPSAEALAVTKLARPIFHKSTMLQSAIEQGTLEGLRSKREALLQCLRARGQAGPRRRTAEVWELQRRITLLQDSWHAPFLPHERSAQWRWVDARYCRHPWVSVEKDACAGSDVPPLQPPEGWHQDAGGWAVAEGPGPCDGACWQYAVDFYTSDALWGESPALCHCRRRLWRCTFTK